MLERVPYKYFISGAGAESITKYSSSRLVKMSPADPPFSTSIGSLFIEELRK
jgi:hypothetical protein